MSEQAIAQAKPQSIQTTLTSVSHGILQRCSNGVECEECRKKRESSLQRAAVNTASTSGVPPIVHEVLRSPGQSLDAGTRAFMEPRFGHDFSGVRVHTDARAAESARAVNALAYTVGRDVVFGAGQYAPGTMTGERLLAHELTHTIQQGRDKQHVPTVLEIANAGSTSEKEAEASAQAVIRGYSSSSVTSQAMKVARQAAGLAAPCLPATVCSAPAASRGTAEAFSRREETAEAPTRTTRSAMPPAAIHAQDHGLRSTDLETFFEQQSPGQLNKIHGIFVDRDMSPNVGGRTRPCNEFIPPILGAAKPCVFIPGKTHDEAKIYNTTSAPTIGGVSRELWRVRTLQTLTHEVQHVTFETAPHAALNTPSCTRVSVAFELSELNAIISEFPIVFRAIPKASAKDQMQQYLSTWFTYKIKDAEENVQGTLRKLRCKCSCQDANKYIVDTFNFVSASWTKEEKLVFHTELSKPEWGLDWPFASEVKSGHAGLGALIGALGLGAIGALVGGLLGGGLGALAGGLIGAGLGAGLGALIGSLF